MVQTGFHTISMIKSSVQSKTLVVQISLYIRSRFHIMFPCSEKDDRKIINYSSIKSINQSTRYQPSNSDWVKAQTITLIIIGPCPESTSAYSACGSPTGLLLFGCPPYHYHRQITCPYILYAPRAFYLS